MSTAIELETVAKDVQVRVTRNRDCCFLACVSLKAEPYVPMAVLAQYPETIRRASNGAVQFGTVLFFLAAGQAELLFAWLQEDAQ